MEKLIFFLFLAMLPYSSFAEWKISKDEKSGLTTLSNSKNKKITYEIEKNLGESKVLKVEKIQDDFELIIYSAGTAGTYKIVKITNAVLFRKSDKKFLADFPYKYEYLTEKEKIPQPKWNFSKNNLEIIDVTRNLKKKIDLKD